MTSGKHTHRKKQKKDIRRRTAFPMLHCKQFFLCCECCSCFLTSWLSHFHTARGPIKIIRGTCLCTYAYMFKWRNLIISWNRPKLKKNPSILLMSEFMWCQSYQIMVSDGLDTSVIFRLIRGVTLTSPIPVMEIQLNMMQWTELFYTAHYDPELPFACLMPPC